MEVEELKMLRFALGVTRMDKIRNEYIRGTAQVGLFGEKTREAILLSWYGYVRRKDDGYIGRRMLRMESTLVELSGKRKRGRPKSRSMVKEDVAEDEVTLDDTEDRNNCKWKIRKSAVAPPDGKSRKEKKKKKISELLYLDVRGGHVPHVDDGNVEMRHHRHLAFEQTLRHKHAGRGDVLTQHGTHHETRVYHRQLEPLIGREVLHILPCLYFGLYLTLGVRCQVFRCRPVALVHRPVLVRLQ